MLFDPHSPFHSSFFHENNMMSPFCLPINHNVHKFQQQKYINPFLINNYSNFNEYLKHRVEMLKYHQRILEQQENLISIHRKQIEEQIKFFENQITCKET